VQPIGWHNGHTSLANRQLGRFPNLYKSFPALEEKRLRGVLMLLKSNLHPRFQIHGNQLLLIGCVNYTAVLAVNGKFFIRVEKARILV
jgi:hypothetical protein